MDAPQAPPPAAAASSIQALPLELLQRCVALLPPEDKRAGFEACDRLARAVLLNSLQQEETPGRLVLFVDREEPFTPSATLLQQLVGPQDSKGATLVLYSDSGGNPERCLAELQASGVVLTCATRLELQRLSLDALVPDGVSAFLPNLRQLRVSSCQLTAAAEQSLIDLGCSRLQHVELQLLRAPLADIATTQLQQLAGLPSLSSLSLLDRSCPTVCLEQLSTQLTALRLDGDFVDYSATLDAAQWRATLQHVALCTALQSLTIPCSRDEELAAVAPALQRLPRLRLNHQRAAPPADAMVERLLALPHLTSLHWGLVSSHAFQRSHADSPCRWRELNFGLVSPRHLAHLPLRSLTSPVAWSTILLDARASVGEVQAAVDNVARGCPAGGAWRPEEADCKPGVSFLSPAGGTFARGASEGDTPAALLRALRPLLAAPGLRSLDIRRLAWDAELVRALGEVLPRTCRRLGVSHGSWALPASIQVPRSLPWLEELEFTRVVMHPQTVTSLVSCAAGREEARRPDDGGLVLRKVTVVSPAPPVSAAGSWDEDALEYAWEEVEEVVQDSRVGVELVVVLR